MLERWDPAPWADLFARAGARYVVHVTKHHDGYCLWPTSVREPAPARTGRRTRDVVGDLAGAVRARGMRFGVYYSGGLDWTFEPRPIVGIADGLRRGAARPRLRALRRRALPRADRARTSRACSGTTSRSRRTTARCGASSPTTTTRCPEGVVNDRFLPAPRGSRARCACRPLARLVDALAARVSAQARLRLRAAAPAALRLPHARVRASSRAPGRTSGRRRAASRTRSASTTTRTRPT